MIKKIIIFTSLICAVAVCHAESNNNLVLSIQVDNCQILGSVYNNATNVINVQRTFGWWEFTTVFYHDGQRWREAKQVRGPCVQLGKTETITLNPGQILRPEQPASVGSHKWKMAQYTFILDLSQYELPKDLGKITKLRVVTCELWSNIHIVKDPNMELKATDKSAP